MTENKSKTNAKPRKERQTETDAPPGTEDLQILAANLRSMANDSRQAGVFARLFPLAASAPRALLFEGGTDKERTNAVILWGLILNCESPQTVPGKNFSLPCLSCPTCLKFLAKTHRDLFFLDGEAGSITIDEVRAVRTTLGEAAREARYRTVILSEAQNLTEAAANALLKSLEEAPSGTVFVLTVPQRERLLPTLVSRSFVLTLAWPDPLTGPNQSPNDWAATAAEFLATGKGLFAITGTRGGVDAPSARQLISALQRGAAQALAWLSGKNIPQGASPEADLARFFASLPELKMSIALAVLDEGQDSLNSQVNPALVADWIMTRLYLLKPKNLR